MKFTQDDHEKVINALKTTYHEKDEAEIDAQWQQNVMRDIRRLGPLRSEVKNSLFWGRFLWRAAPAICVILLIVGALVINLDFMSEFELSGLLNDDPFASTTIDSFFM